LLHFASTTNIRLSRKMPVISLKSNILNIIGLNLSCLGLNLFPAFPHFQNSFLEELFAGQVYKFLFHKSSCASHSHLVSTRGLRIQKSDVPFLFTTYLLIIYKLLCYRQPSIYCLYLFFAVGDISALFLNNANHQKGTFLTPVL
jgi:hypothetical protein